MKDTLMSREELLVALRKNRETHQDTYTKAVEGYRQKAAEVIERALEDVKNGGFHDPWALSRLPVPEDHSADYDTAIAMLEVDRRNELLLDERSFRRFVRDEWEWKREWAQTSAIYTDAAG